MKTSDSQSNLVAALIEAQGSFPLIAKSHEGQAGNRRFKYAPLEDVLAAVRPVLLANKLLLTQGTDGNELVTRLDHASGEWREHRMPINAEHANMQSYGIELTYRRRYAIQPMLGIITEDDTDGKGADKRKGTDHTKALDMSHSGPAIVFAGLQPEVQDYLRRNAPAIEAAMPDVAKITGMIDAALDDWPKEMRNEVKTGLWYLLGSKTRSAIKAHSQAK